MTPEQAGELAGEKLAGFGLINEPPRESDYIHGEEARLGGSAWTKIKSVVNGVITWVDDVPEYEYQRKAVETNGCVSFSGDNVCEYLLNNRIKTNLGLKSSLEALGLIKNGKVNVSDRRTAKGSGTDPNQGNTVRAVDDYIRNFLFCPEDLYPFTDSMTRDVYYGIMPVEVADFGKKVKPLIEIETKYLPQMSGKVYCSPETLVDGLGYSPVWVSVKGSYDYVGDIVQGTELKQLIDDAGLQGASYYSHRVSIRAAVIGQYWEIHDHYQNQIVKFAWNYPFGGAKIIQIIEKKTADFIQVGKSILFLAKGGAFVGNYFGYDSGDVLKAIHGEYSKVTPRELLPEGQFPQNYIGKLKIELNP